MSAAAHWKGQSPVDSSQVGTVTLSLYQTSFHWEDGILPQSSTDKGPGLQRRSERVNTKDSQWYHAFAPQSTTTLRGYLSRRGFAGLNKIHVSFCSIGSIHSTGHIQRSHTHSSSDFTFRFEGNWVPHRTSSGSQLIVA